MIVIRWPTGIGRTIKTGTLTGVNDAGENDV
jgi:hypothetical protein